MLMVLPPLTVTSLHTSFFMASLGFTHGPPVLLHPGVAVIVASMPSESANATAYA